MLNTLCHNCSIITSATFIYEYVHNITQQTLKIKNRRIVNKKDYPDLKDDFQFLKNEETFLFQRFLICFICVCWVLRLLLYFMSIFVCNFNIKQIFYAFKIWSKEQHNSTTTKLKPKSFYRTILINDERTDRRTDGHKFYIK